MKMPAPIRGLAMALLAVSGRCADRRAAGTDTWAPARQGRCANRRPARGIEEAEPGRGHEGLFLWRVGTGYTWEFDERYAVGPSFCLDFVREAPGEWGRAFVFGVSVGIAF